MRNAVVLGFFALFFLFDVYVDVNDGIPFSHIWHELFLFLIALASLIWQILAISKKEKKIQLLNSELLETKRSYQEWQSKSQDSAQKIRVLIDQQFDNWLLSPGEKDVALLLLKGLAMKEIAVIRNTQEKTVRQQATNIYKKSGLSGRQELSAFFLEDILSTPIQLS